MLRIVFVRSYQCAMLYQRMKSGLPERKQRILCAMLLSLLVLAVVYWNLQPYYPRTYYFPGDRSKFFLSFGTSKVNKTILYWNTFFGTKDFNLGVGNEIFQNCLFANCYATNDRSFAPVDKFDAVVFHGARYKISEDGAPARRDEAQKYVFFSWETALNCDFDADAVRNFYNWTMTYRRDSDVFLPYSLVERTKVDYRMPGLEVLRRKTRAVAWFVSNCYTEGSKKRMAYAQELAKHIQVDIYGKCGNLSCDDKTECYRMLEDNYLFYLSFENSWCEDYVTEKLFNVLKMNVVPIVYGAADYKALAPHNSVINTRDFQSPKNLAQFLHRLSADMNQYVRYFEWKKNYVLESGAKNALCQLCELLNRPKTYSSYNNIQSWFVNKCSN